MPPRPRDRKAQITAAAQDLFAHRGYHGVGVAEVARSVGITGSAVYRHFGGKQELLAGSVDSALDAVAARLDGVGANATPAHVLVPLTALSLDQRGIALMWEREARHLTEAQQAGVRARIRCVETRLARTLAAPGSSARLRRRSATPIARSRAALAVIWSTSYHHFVLPRPGWDALLSAVAQAVAVAEIDMPSDRAARPSAPGGTADTPQRERILEAASTLFAQRGFDAVGVGDIGASLGVSGPSTYRHFPTKSIVLYTALMRAADALHTELLSTDRDGGQANGALEALHEAMRGYVHVMHQRRGVTRLLGTEVVSLPEDLRADVRATQRDYVHRFSAMVRAAYPHLTPDQSEVLLLAALAIVNDQFRRSTSPAVARFALSFARTALDSGANLAAEVNRHYHVGSPPRSAARTGEAVSASRRRVT